MEIKIIATDMDGTFLDNQSSYDRERFKRVFRELQRQGIYFVVASGNQMDRLNQLFAELADDMVFVAENGAKIVEHGNVIQSSHLELTDVEECLKFFAGKHKSYGLMLTGEKASYALRGMALKFEDFPMEERELEDYFSSLYWLDSFEQRPEDKISKMSMMVSLADVDRIIKEFNQRSSIGFSNERSRKRG